MKSAWIVVVAVCVVLTSAAFAQTPRQMGMGGAAIGVADDAGAWFQNPAGLGALNVACPTEGKECLAPDRFRLEARGPLGYRCRLC